MSVAYRIHNTNLECVLLFWNFSLSFCPLRHSTLSCSVCPSSFKCRSSSNISELFGWKRGTLNVSFVSGYVLVCIVIWMLSKGTSPFNLYVADVNLLTETNGHIKSKLAFITMYGFMLNSVCCFISFLCLIHVIETNCAFSCNLRFIFRINAD